MIKINGTDIAAYEESSLCRQIAVASQYTEFVAGTLRENLLLSGAVRSDADIEKILALLELSTLTEKLPNGLDTVLSEETASFSDGEKKRLGLARALLSDASILIFDEPTSSLDNKTKEPVMEIIRDACKDKILMFVTHDAGVVRAGDVGVFIGE